MYSLFDILIELHPASAVCLLNNKGGSCWKTGLLPGFLYFSTFMNQCMGYAFFALIIETVILQSEFQNLGKENKSFCPDPDPYH